MLRAGRGDAASQFLQLVHQRAELQLAEQGLHFGRVEGVGFGLLEIERNRQIGADGGEIAAHVSGFFPRFQLGAPARLDLVQVGIDVVEGGVLAEQVFGGLLAHAGHARDVVGRVADDGLIVHHLLRADAELAHHVVGGDVILVVARQIDDGALVHQLQQVAVAGDNFDAQSLRGAPAGGRAEHVVGLEAFHFEARDVEGVHHLADALDLRAQVVGHLGARSLVFGVDIVAEGLAGIEGHRQVIGLFLLVDAQEFAGEAVDAGGGFAFGGLPARRAAGRITGEGIIHAIGQGMAVNQVQRRGHGVMGVMRGIRDKTARATWKYLAAGGSAGRNP